MFPSCGAVEPLIGVLSTLGWTCWTRFSPRQGDGSCQGGSGMAIAWPFTARSIPSMCFHAARQTACATKCEDDARLGRGGGFCAGSEPVLQTDVSTENILALYDTDMATAPK